jgi:DNA-binding transcriptional MerR regulator
MDGDDGPVSASASGDVSGDVAGVAASDAGSGEELTIDALGDATGVTVRNIRAHQSRGLLAPPRLVGRTGLYGPAHVRRLEQIRRLQGQGLNLAAIARVVDHGRLVDVATGPFTDAAPEYRAPDELLSSLGLTSDDPAIERAVRMGLITLEPDRIRVEVPRLVDVAEQLAADGVPLAAMLDAVEAVEGASSLVARSFMKLADEHLVDKVVTDTDGELDQITSAVERLRAHAGAVLDAMFNRAMSAEISSYLASDPAASASGSPEADAG